MQIAVLGIDLGKNSCSVAALDGSGRVVKLRRMRPGSIVTFTKTYRPASSPWRPAAARTISAAC